MIKLKDTLGLCEVCYRHVPATRFLRDGQIWLSKTCPEHGYTEHLIEPDADFYQSFAYEKHKITTYLIEVTNKCNLACPNCYQLPDNMSTDPTIEELLNIIKSWPDDGYGVAICGAEPTARKDLPELLRAIADLPGKKRPMMVLTNGVNLAKKEYAEQFIGIPKLLWTIGLNHPDYQGHTVRAKQMQAMDNLKELELPIKNISYTLKDLSQLEYCLLEIQEFGYSRCQQYRIRVGADIGRTPEDHEKVYLSQLLTEVKKYCEKHNWSFEMDASYPNTNKSHYSALINGIKVKIIQWPDVKTLDLSEMQTESWAAIIPGLPVSPLVHQVILRDALTNKKMKLPDVIPIKWIDNYDKNNV